MCNIFFAASFRCILFLNQLLHKYDHDDDHDNGYDCEQQKAKARRKDDHVHCVQGLGMTSESATFPGYASIAAPQAMSTVPARIARDPCQDAWSAVCACNSVTIACNAENGSALPRFHRSKAMLCAWSAIKGGTTCARRSSRISACTAYPASTAVWLGTRATNASASTLINANAIPRRQ